MTKVYLFLIIVFSFLGCSSDREKVTRFDGEYIFSENESLKLLESPSEVQKSVFREMSLFSIKLVIHDGLVETHIAKDIHHTDSIRFENDTLYFSLFDTYDNSIDKFIEIDNGLMYIDTENLKDSLAEKRIAVFIKNQNLQE